MDLEIRDATPADAAAVVPLVVELGDGFHRPPRTDETLVVRYLEQPGCGILLAVADDAVVGFLAYATTVDLYLGSPAGEIVDLLVTGRARGAGVGSALVAAALRRFEAAGCGQVRVVAGRENGPALHIYQKAGLIGELVCLHRHLDAGTRDDG